MNLRLNAACLILLVGFGSSSSGAPKAKDKSWHFLHAEIWLGRLSKDQSVPVTFEVENDLDAPLKIVSTDTSCRCIALDFAPVEIPAHGSGTFRWQFNTSRSHGSVEDTIMITGEDGRNIVGTFKAFVSNDSTKAQ